MSMSVESENFEQLRRLIALKKYEQPPPGYFHHFSREVIVRIKAGDKGEAEVVSWWSWEGSWMQRAWAAIETRPVLAGAFGVAMCGFFATGALLSTNADSNVGIIEGYNIAQNPSRPPINAPWERPTPVNLISKTPPVTPSLFDEIQRFQQSPQIFMNVNYVPGN